MIDTPQKYEIPVELRDFAQKSVDQARKAFDGFLGAAQKAVSTFESQSTHVPFGSQEVARRTLSYAENNIAAAFDLAEKLVRAKDLNEVTQYQSEYLKNQFAALQEQARDFGATLQKSASEATQQMQTVMKEAADKTQETVKTAAETAKSSSRSGA